MSRDRAARPLLDGALDRFLRWFTCALAPLPRAWVRGACVGGMALLATLSWPLSSVRARSRAAGLSVRPWRWGALLGRNLATLLNAPPPVAVTGWPDQPGPTVVLAGHCGDWEAGAAAIAARGLRPFVLSAPWPRLPRVAAFVRERRALLGVHAEPRGRRALVNATRHLRDGGWVVVLVDSLNPSRPGRRPLPFADADVAPPDGLVRWAARQDAAVLVAEPSDDGFTLRPILDGGVPLSDAQARDAADTVVSTLRACVRSRPATWAWVRALATLTLTLLGGCAPEPLPPLPLEPSAWEADLQDLRWSGVLADRPVTLRAQAMRGRMLDGAPTGAFEDLELSVGDGDRAASLLASRAAGRWPDGPLVLQEVYFTLRRGDAEATSGDVPEVTWADGTLSCGGCPLERFAAELR